MKIGMKGDGASHPFERHHLPHRDLFQPETGQVRVLGQPGLHSRLESKHDDS